MLAYVLLAVLAVPLVMLIVDMAVPRNARRAAGPTGPVPTMPPEMHGSATRSAPSRPAPVVTQLRSHDEVMATRAPRISPGDGMVYRGPQRTR